MLRFGEPLEVVLADGLFAAGLPDEFFAVVFLALWPVLLEVFLDPPLADAELLPEDTALVVLALVPEP